MEKEEGSCPIGVFRQPFGPTSLTEEGGLLVAGHPPHRDFKTQLSPMGMAKDPGASPNLWKHLFRNLQDVQQLRIPRLAGKIVEKGPGSVGVVRGMDRSVGQAGD
jgi:hypothetical protein